MISSTVDEKRLRRKLAELYRHKYALEKILEEIKNLEMKYANDAPVLEMLVKLEMMLHQQLEKVIYGIQVQGAKARQMGIV